MTSYSQWQSPDGALVVSDDPARLDVDVICGFLSRAYWSPGVPREVVERAIANSLVFGVFERSRAQIGFARVITDCATLAYLTDVFVCESFQRPGLSRWLMSVIDQYPKLRGLRRWPLGTPDAPGLYASFGFVPVSPSVPPIPRLEPDGYPYGETLSSLTPARSSGA